MLFFTNVNVVFICIAGPGTTTTTNGNTVTVTLNRSAQQPAQTATVAGGGPQVVAISNNLNARSKPYPVQESVTVVPLLQPQMPAQYAPPPQMNIGYPPGPTFPQNFGKHQLANHYEHFTDNDFKML